jgi:hypothetical protein
MYFLRSTQSNHRVPFATLELAIAKLQATLMGIEKRGAAVAFNDSLEYEVGASRIWIEDADGLHVLSEEPCLDC